MIRPVLGAVVLLMTIPSACLPAFTENPIETVLKISAATAPPDSLRIRFFSGGGVPFGHAVEMEIRGDGTYLRYDREAQELPALENKGTLDRERLKPLLRLLVDMKVWQDVPLTRNGVPDEGLSWVKVSSGKSEASISEWQNDMDSRQRLIRVEHEMETLVPAGTRSCVLVPKPPTPEVYAKMHAIVGVCDGLN